MVVLYDCLEYLTHDVISSLVNTLMSLIIANTMRTPNPQLHGPATQPLPYPVVAFDSASSGAPPGSATTSWPPPAQLQLLDFGVKWVMDFGRLLFFVVCMSAAVQTD